MKRSLGLAAGLLAALVVAAPVSAGPAKGHIEPADASTPTSGQTFLVDASIDTTAPVVAYEYAIQNECKFPNRTGSSLQRDDIVYWTFDPGDGLPHAILPVYLQAVPVSSTCKVVLVKNNTVVKGSTYSYTVN